MRAMLFAIGISLLTFPLTTCFGGLPRSSRVEAVAPVLVIRDSPPLDAIHSRAETSAMDHGRAHQGHISDLPLAVDGARTPEDVPDYIAYRHFVQVYAIAATASPSQKARRDAFLARVDLSPTDQGALLLALQGVREELDVIAAQRRLLPLDVRASPGAFATLKARHDEVLDTARYRVLANLTAHGRKAVDDHVQRWMKKHIKIYGQLP